MFSGKRVVLFLLLTLTLVLCASCEAFLDNGIEPFGDAHFNALSTYLRIDDTSWLYLEGKLYCEVGLAGDGAVKGENVAAFNGRDHYSYIIFRTENDDEGILIVKSYSKFNMVNVDSIYVSEDAIAVPASYLENFPRYDTWFDGGWEVTMNGKVYCRYGSSKPGYTVGDELFTYGGKSFYSILGETLWVACRNAKDSSRYDFYYVQSEVTELPVSIIVETTTDKPEE